MRMAAWQLQEAEQRFGEVVRLAERDGPQTITRHGEAIAVLVPIRLWRKQDGDAFKELLVSGADADLPDVARDPRPARVVEL